MNTFSFAALFRPLCHRALCVLLAMLVQLVIAPCAIQAAHIDVMRTVPIYTVSRHATAGTLATNTPEGLAANYAADFVQADENRMPVMEANASLQLTYPYLAPPPMPQSSPAEVFGRVFASSAHAAYTAHAGTSERVVMRSPQELTAKINPLGPEGWPLQESLHTGTTPLENTTTPINTASSGAISAPVTDTRTPIQTSSPMPSSAPVSGPVSTPTSPEKPSLNTQSTPQPIVQPVPQPVAQPTPERQATSPPPMPATRAGASPQAISTNSTRPVIYLDEAGHVVPKPPEPEKLLEEAEKLLDNARYAEAIAKLEEIKPLPIPRTLREKTLYLISDATEALYAGKPLEAFDPVLSTTSEALNANLRAPRVPEALFRLGMAHLRVDNFTEADGYFKALKRRFPSAPEVPTAFTNLGTALLAKGQYAQAAAALRVVVQDYPEAQVLREAAVGLVRALYHLGEFVQAELIADFVDKRWPRYYLGDADFLKLMAELNIKLSRLEPALQLLWLYYNLDPTRPDTDTLLVSIGDIYLRTSRLQAGLDIFADIIKRFPDSAGAETALLRLSEKGIHEGHITEEEMFRVFANPGTPIPPVAYREIQQKWPKGRHAALVHLKLALWQLWDRQYTDAMGTAADFMDAHPENPNIELAKSVIFQSFMADLARSLAEENYGRILLLWNGFPVVRERYGPLDPDLRNALARGYLERGDEKNAIELLSEFLKTPKHPRYSDPTLALYFNKYLQTENWNALLDLGELVKDWDMTPAVRGQMDYALALSAQNLGLMEKALELWKKLVHNDVIQLYQRAYSAYFLAKDAERRKDIKDAYAYNREALEHFLQLEQERSDKADPHRVKDIVNALMDITEVSNRIPEALEWVERYNDFVPADSPEYPGLRFREARLYRKLGNTAKAKALLEQIATQHPDSPFAKAAAAELRTFEVSRDLRNFMPQ